MSALCDSQDWHTVLDEESSTQLRKLKDNNKLVSLGISKLKCFHWTVYGYVKTYETGSSAYRAWVEGSKVNEGAEREIKKKGERLQFFLCLEKLRLLQYWFCKDKSYIYHNKPFKFCLKKIEDLVFLNVVGTNIRSYPFHLFSYTLSLFLALLRSVLKKLFLSVSVHTQVCNLFPLFILLMDTAYSPPPYNDRCLLAPITSVHHAVLPAAISGSSAVRIHLA